MKNSLAPLRMFVGICLFFGLLGLGFMFWISTWARDGASGRFVTSYLPGTTFSPEILPRLGELGGGALGLGLALFVVERIATARAKRRAAIPHSDRAVRPPQTPLQIGATIVLSLLIAVVGVLGYKWYAYVTNTTSPYDEIGIELNARAPGPINAWGCAQLKARFGARTVPPYACAKPEGGWK